MDEREPSQTLEIALARTIVRQVAPQELPLFAETVESLSGGGRRTHPKDDPLGFAGPGTVEIVLTGIACGAAHEVVKAMAEGVGEGLMARWRRFRPGRKKRVDVDPQALPALTEERIAELGGVARRTAILLGLPPDKSDLLAAAVTDHLKDLGPQQG
jgi:hypothetical protein